MIQAVTYYDEGAVAALLGIDVLSAMASGALPGPEATTVHGVRLWATETINAKEQSWER